MALLNQKIALVICADDGYINNNFAIATIKSFLFHNKWFNDDIIFFNDNKFFMISNENKQLLKNIYNKVIFKEIDYSKYEYIIESFKKINDNNKKFLKAYPKFEMFGLLNEYDKILCVDGDILFVDNIKTLFKKNIPFGVTSSILHNHYLITQNIKYTEFNKNEKLTWIDSGAFNSGLIYLGNKQLRNITDLIINYIKNNIISNYNQNNKELKYFDQCILSYFFNEKNKDLVTIIEPIYNVEIGDYKYYYDKYYYYELYNNIYNDNIKNYFLNAKVLHYLFKPSIIDDNLYFKKIWNFYKELPIDIINNGLWRNWQPR